VEINKINIILT